MLRPSTSDVKYYMDRINSDVSRQKVCERVATSYYTLAKRRLEPFSETFNIAAYTLTAYNSNLMTAIEYDPPKRIAARCNEIGINLIVVDRQIEHIDLHTLIEDAVYVIDVSERSYICAIV